MPIGKYTRPPADQRFWRKVNKDGPTPPHRPELGPCWLWTGDRIPSNGYGSFTFRGKTAEQNRQRITTHRFAWILAHGAIPDGLCILHACDVRLCVRLEHLFPGTSADNAADMAQKGRVRPGRHPGLTADDVRAIRIRYAIGSVTQVRLATEYGVSQANISNILLQKVWKHVS